MLRPGVVWFGEPIDPDVIAKSTDALDCDVFFTVGTSAQVFPAAALAHEARHRGAFTVELNLESTPSSNAVDLSVQGPATDLLQTLEELLLGRP